MSWLDKLIEMRRASGMSLDELSRASGVPKGTLAKITSGATRDPKLETVLQLVTSMGYSLGDLEDAPAAKKKTPPYSDEAAALAKDFDTLDRWGRRQVRSVTDNELARIAGAAPETVPAPPPARIIPLLGSAFAAGAGEPDFGNVWTDYQVPAESPAEFAIRINGDSMEPWLPDGSIALCRKTAPRDGDVAALLIDGEFLCKQVCIDSVGALHLFSLNRARKNLDRDIPADDIDRQIKCFGTVIMKDHIPLPLD